MLSVLATMALGAIASSTASAAVEGPWWKQRKEPKAEQKFLKNTLPAEEDKITNKNEGNFELSTKFLGSTITTVCELVESKGTIWNGENQGEDEDEVTFTKCFLSGTKGCVLTVTPVKAVSEQMYKYESNKKELEEVGTQKMFVVFGTKEGASFTVLKFATTGCGLFTGQKAEIKPTGLKNEAWTNQKGEKFKVTWGTAAEVSRENECELKPKLKWVKANVKLLHHQGKEAKAELQFAGEPAELVGTIAILAETATGEKVELGDFSKKT
jgi:hypothetical protein